MTSGRLPWPQRTTTWAGTCLVISAAMLMVLSARLALPITDSFSVPLFGVIPELVAEAVLLAGFVILAVGAPGELDVTGRSRLGRVCLILWGARPFLLDLSDALPIPDLRDLNLFVYSSWAFQVGACIASVLGAAIVAHRRILTGPARWALLAAALIDVAWNIPQLVPLPIAFIPFTLEPAYLLWTGILLLTGITYLLYGRIEAVKRRAAIINANW